MKGKLLAIVFAFFALAMTAQDAIKVDFKGANPSITDLAWAFLKDASEYDEEECGDHPTDAVYNAMINNRDGIALDEGETLTIDEKNGYIVYEWVADSYVIRMEMCYWNEVDGKHKLFAFNNMASFYITDGRPIVTETSGMTFYRYNNATKEMTYCTPPGFTMEYSNVAYALPRTGKDITITKWHNDGTKTAKTLKWNGRRFGH